MLDLSDPRSFDPRGPGPSDRREADDLDACDALISGLERPRTRERDRAHAHEQEYTMRRALATIGTFRVVPTSDLHDGHGRVGDLSHGDLERMRSAGLARRVTPVEGHRRTLMALTERGRALLE